MIGYGGTSLCASRAVVCLGVFLMLTAGCGGCSETGDESERGPYRVGEVEIVADDWAGPGDQDWGPISEHVGQWLEVALQDSERGLTRHGQGMEMRATVHHGIQVRENGGRAMLHVDVEILLERALIDEDSPMVVLSAQAQYRHPFALGRPSRGVLDPISRTLTRRAIDDVVGQLRDQAVVRQTMAEQLASRIGDADLSESARLLAIGLVAKANPGNAEEALAEATRDPHDAVAVAAAISLYEMKSDQAAYGLMNVAKRMSRDREYDTYLELLPLLGDLNVDWVNLYLETIAEAHRIGRVRDSVRSLLNDEPGLPEPSVTGRKGMP